VPTPTPPPIEIPEGKTMEEVLVVIDPGHGGNRIRVPHHPMKRIFMKRIVTLDIALKVRDLLTEAGIDTILTRDN
jgi:N-acetylmuramoyl-L-alanine amidase